MKEKDVKYIALIGELYENITFIHNVRISRIKGNRLVFIIKTITGGEIKHEIIVHSHKDARRFKSLILNLIS